MRILIWLLFGVASAVLPLFLAAIVMFDHGRFVQWSDTWSRGADPISMTLSWLPSAIWSSTERHIRKRKRCTVAAFFLIIIAAVWYMDVFGGLLGGQVDKQEFLRHWSPWLFTLSLTSAAFCIMLPKIKE